MHTACVWSEKLPFAGYSVVKELLDGPVVPPKTHSGLDTGDGFLQNSGEYRARTGDLLVANQALSQLS